MGMGNGVFSLKLMEAESESNLCRVYDLSDE